ncbi:unnamed protein product [Effrenium voratum]|nr:unnamed protein product [Effrenium voratum]
MAPQGSSPKQPESVLPDEEWQESAFRYAPPQIEDLLRRHEANLAHAMEDWFQRLAGIIEPLQPAKTELTEAFSLAVGNGTDSTSTNEIPKELDGAFVSPTKSTTRLVRSRRRRPGTEPQPSLTGGGTKLIHFALLLHSLIVASMAMPSGSGGIPLTEFRRDLPPGWEPGDPNYSLTTYFQRLWYLQTEVPDECVGPIVAGRWTLVRLSVDEVRDPADPAQILQHAIPSGVQALCNALRAAFGQTDEQLLTKALEAFFDFKRKNAMTLQEFSLEWDLRFEEAQTRAGLDMNMVGHKGDIFYGEDSRAEEHEMDPNSEDYFDYQAADSMYYWYDGDDWWSPDHDYQDYYEDHVIEDWWHDESDWQEDATADQATSWTADFDKPDPENQDPGNAEVYGKGFNKGKGKGRGKSKGKFKGKYSGPRYYTETNEMNQANRGTKNLSFSFHVGLYKTGGDSSDEVYHTVGGHRRRGLIIDPGAANSLVGTETLRDLVDHCDQSSVIKTSMQWQEKQAEVTGISGQSDPILGQVTLPLPMFEELSKATYTADVIGGNASLCPALVGNPGLVGMRAVIASAWFQNNDGLLILPKDKEMKTFSLHRLLLTDSKHYLLPVNNKLHSENEERRKAATFLSNVQEQSTKKWSDTKYSVWHSEGQSPGRKRSEPPESPAGKQEHLSIVDGTDLEPEHYWTVDFGDDGPIRVTRVHLRPRMAFFLPTDVELPPGVEADLLQDGRSTEVQPRDGQPAHDVFDNWRTNNPVNPFTWTGFTHFTLREDTTHAAPSPEQESPDSPPEAFHCDLKDHHRTGPDECYFNLPSAYPGDEIPQELPAQKQQQLRRQYKLMPEEYYQHTGKRVIKPDNYHQWANSRSRKKCHLWEICSGSSRLSLLALISGLMVAFPVDLRYGWDIGNQHHQELLLHAQDLIDPDVILMSPNCRPWSISANRKKPADRDRDRGEEFESLCFLLRMAQRQAERGKAFILEQPFSSAMWTLSPMARLRDIEGCWSSQRVDQCVHGACDENRIPIMKPTGLQANMALRNSCKRCQGRHRDHSQLQGSDHLGRQRTIMAAVYPRGFCKAIIADIKRFIGKPSRGHEDYHIYYKCDRCRLGREAPPGTQHSLVPRECRHASSLPTPETSSAKVSRNVTTTLPDLMEQFKREAMRHPTIHDIKLAMDYEMPAIDTLMLKLLFLKVVEEGVNVIEAHKQKYRRWTEDRSTWQSLVRSSRRSWM